MRGIATEDPAAIAALSTIADGLDRLADELENSVDTSARLDGLRA
jgi:hypothetical protein